MDIKPAVYVCCSTYNQSSFIRETMDGFCMQKTSFPFVCGILDDSSTDDEQETIRRYMEVNFSLDERDVTREEETDDYKLVFTRHKKNTNCYFVALFLKYNHYSIRKTKRPYISEWCDNAKYIAFCEGDDYWIDPLKLQKQVDYLEHNNKCGLVYTRAKVYNQETDTIINSVGDPCKSFLELLLHNSIPTLTVMCRVEVYKSYYESIEPSKHKWKMGDYPLWLYIAANYDIHFVDEITSVYRRLAESASHSGNYQKRLDFLKSSRDIRLYYANTYDMGEKVKDQIDDVYWRSRSIVLEGVDKKAFKEALRNIRLKTFKEYVKTFLYCLFHY